MSEHAATTAFAPGAADTRAAVAEWLSHLAAERRMSPKTVEAYGRDVRDLLVFLTRHLGTPPSVADVVGLAPRDVRAYLAARRADGLVSRSLMRALAAARSFTRFLARTGRG
ncbi:site-specific integrase, partial [Methylopila musalis]